MSESGHRAHDRAAEDAVIGSVILVPDDFHAVSLEPEAFFFPENRLAWEAMQQIVRDGKPIDPILVEAEAGHRSVDAMKLAELAGSVPTTANLPFYVERVRLCEITRMVDAACRRTIAAGEEGDELLQVMQAELSAVESGKQSGTVTPSRAIDDFLCDLDDDESEDDVVTTGVDEWDEYFWAEPGDVITIAGRPSMGKTALAQWATWQYVCNGFPWLVCLAEGTVRKFYRRLISMQTGINTKRIRQRNLSRAEVVEIRDAADRIRQAPLYVNDSCRMLPDMLRAIRRAKHEHGVKGVTVDHLQHIRVPGVTKEFERINEVCDALSNIADENPRVVLMQLSQLNRGVEKESDKRPGMSFLRGSGRLEEVSDIVAFPWRGWYYDRNKFDARQMEVGVGKNREGETGTVRMEWEHKHGYVAGPDRYIATEKLRGERMPRNVEQTSIA